MKKIFLFLILAIILFAIFYFFGEKKSDNQPAVIINNQKFSVEIAETPEARSRGLGGKENLCPDCGMLFVFPEDGIYTFWMKDMKFPLDIIWIANGKAAYIAKNISPEFKGVINPGLPADKVLEINAGLSDKYGIKEGSEAVIK